MRWVYFLWVLLLAFGLPFQFHRATRGFQLRKVQISDPFRAQGSYDPSEEALSILNQPFSYFDKGAQVYVFASQDGRHVLKLLRTSKALKKSYLQQEAKIVRFFKACEAAWTHLPEETGLIYLHLNPTKGKLPKLNCRDAIGRGHSLSLDNCRFVLQKRAEPFRKTLEEAAKTDPAKMERCLDSLIALLQSRVKKGIGNSDPTLSRNFGFLGEQAIELDFGNYFSNPDLANRQKQLDEMGRYLARLRRWLGKTSPEWVSVLDEKALWLQEVDLNPSRASLD